MNQFRKKKIVVTVSKVFERLRYIFITRFPILREYCILRKTSDKAFTVKCPEFGMIRGFYSNIRSASAKKKNENSNIASKSVRSLQVGTRLGILTIISNVQNKA